jgi:hypothetical protein
MRQAGEVIRSDVGFFPDGRPKGNGTAVFVNPEDARAAIGTSTRASAGFGAYSLVEMFNGYDWFGSILEVREDRFAGTPGGGRGGFGGGFRGGFRGGFGGGGFRGGFNGPGLRGGFGGGFRGGFGGGGMGLGRGGMHAQAAGAAGGRNFSNDLYADYNGPEGQGGMQVDSAGSGLQPEPAEPNQQIMVRNVSAAQVSGLASWSFADAE